MTRVRTFLSLVTIIALLGLTVYSQQQGTPSVLRVRTDANGYLVTATAAQTLPITTSVFSNTRLRTDASGNLLIVNTGGGFSGQLLGAAADNCAAPPYSFTGDTNTGVCTPVADTLALAAGGATELGVLSGGIRLRSSGVFTWSSANNVTAASDLVLGRDAANALGLRNGTNAQTFRIYRTTDAGITNYERLEIGADISGLGAGTLGVYTRSNGTGGAIPLYIGTSTAADVGFVTNGVTRWRFTSSSGNFIANADNTYDVGQSANFRPQTYYAGTSFNGPAGSTTTVTFGFNGDVNTGIYSPGDGLTRILENGATRLTVGSSAINFNAAFLSNSNLVGSTTAPSAPVACTTPTVVSNNGTYAFRISVGTGCATATLSFTMPAATTGWQCDAWNFDRPTASFPHQSATTTTSATLTNFNAAHASTNWTDADDVVIKCLAY